MTRDSSASSDAASPSRDVQVACVVSGYHGEVTGTMADSARETFVAAGVAPERILVVDAPGAFELPVIAQELAHREDVDAVCCFGLVLKGETEHDVHIANAVANGLQRVALDSGTPVLFGVLTCATLEQAEARARRAADGGLDKGHEVAVAALAAMVALSEAAGDPEAASATVEEAS